MTPLTKDVVREVTLQNGKTYAVRLRAGSRPRLDFREKGKRTWTNAVLLEQVLILAVRGALQ